jgi:hypothetical protein
MGWALKRRLSSEIGGICCDVWGRPQKSGEEHLELACEANRLSKTGDTTLAFEVEILDKTGDTILAFGVDILDKIGDTILIGNLQIRLILAILTCVWNSSLMVM